MSRAGHRGSHRGSHRGARRATLRKENRSERQSASPPKASPLNTKKNQAPSQTEPTSLPPLRLGFVRGVSPSKWAERWTRSVRTQPIELIPVDLAEVQDAREATDLLLERVSPGSHPPHSRGASATRHAIELYEEALALVVDAGHELAAETAVSREDISLVRLLSHPDHCPEWPPPEPWKDPSWAPTDTYGTLELVATGLGGAILPLPLARHLAGKHTHAVLPVKFDDTESPPGTRIWATWEIERDADDIQRFIGMLRGRTERSSR